MPDHLFVVDAPGLLGLNDSVPDARRGELFDLLTPLVEKGHFAVSRAVALDLAVRARDERVTDWCRGLGSSLNKYSADIEHHMWLMRQIQLTLGYEEGLEDLDGKDPSIVSVASYARQLHCVDADFTVVSNDVGEVPLRPTMEELCAEFGWRMCGGLEALTLLGADELLNEP